MGRDELHAFGHVSEGPHASRQHWLRRADDTGVSLWLVPMGIPMAQEC